MCVIYVDNTIIAGPDPMTIEEIGYKFGNYQG